MTNDNTRAATSRPHSRVREALDAAMPLARRGEWPAALASLRASLSLPDTAPLPYRLGGMLALECRNALQAELLFGQAFALDPDDAETLLNLAALALQKKDIRRAIRFYRMAAVADPGAWKTYYLQGLAHLRLDEISPALDCFSEALRREPDEFEPLLRIGKTLFDGARYAKAEQALRKGLTIKPGHAECLSNLGGALFCRQCFEESEACLRQAVHAAPRFAPARVNYAGLLIGKGETAAAEEQLRTALEINPGQAQAYLSLADLGALRPGDPLLKQAEQLVEQKSLSADDTFRVRFALGHIFDKAGDYEQAFTHYATGNQLRRARLRFDIREWTEYAQRAEAMFGRDFFAARQGFGHPEARPVFIVGMPRSGSTLLEQILAAHSRLNAGGELPYLNRIAVHYAQQMNRPLPDCIADIDLILSKRMAADYLESSGAFADGTVRTMDKLPINHRHLGLIALLFPQASIVHCRRNALDTCLSCYFQPFTHQPFAFDLREVGLAYKACDQLMRLWKNALPLPIHDVRYEDLTTRPDETICAALKALGLDEEEACLRFDGSDALVATASKVQVRQGIHSRSVNRWQHYEKHLEPLREALGELAEE